MVKYSPHDIFLPQYWQKTLIYLKIYHHMNNTTLAGHAGVVFTF